MSPRPFFPPHASRRAFLRTLGAGGAALLLPRSLPAADPARAPLFEEIDPAKSGIAFVHENAMSPERYLPETMGPGVAFLDYDNDGWMDIYIVNSGPCDFFTPKTPLRNALYRNNRDGTFTDVTEKAGVAGGTFGMGVAVGDYDNDGYPDLFVTAYGRCILYRNNGDGTFTDVTEKAGRGRARLDHERRLVRLRQRRPPRPLPVQLRRVRRGQERRLRRQQAGAPLLLHPARLQADGRASCSTTTATAPSRRSRRARTSRARSARPWAWWPPTSTTTGSLDLFVANDTVQNFLFMNRGGGQVGRDRPRRRRSGFSANGQPRSGMGVDAADFDGDGWQDLFVANVDNEMFSLYRNNGDESFTRRRERARHRPGHAAPLRLGPQVLRLRQRRPRRPLPGQRPSRRHGGQLRRDRCATRSRCSSSATTARGSGT